MRYTPLKFALFATACFTVGQLHAQPWDPAMKPGTPMRTASPGGLGITSSSALNEQFNDAFNSDFQRLGWQYDLFRMNVPMAWSVSKGKPDVTIAIVDRDFYYPSLSFPAIGFPQHPDIIARQFDSFTGTAGNFLWLSELYRYNGNPLAVYGTNDWFTIDPDFPGTGLIGNNVHGFSIMSLAVARENGEGMVGVAPNVQAVAVNIGSNFAARKVDMDGVTNDVVKVPDVETISALANEASFKTDVESGIVVVVAGGNDLQDYIVSDPRISNLSCSVESAPYLRMTGPRAFEPVSTVWDDLDTKMITVGNVENGQLTGNSCGVYMNDNGWEYSDNRNYSPGREKFPAPGSSRANERRQLAFMDLVVPKNEISASLSFIESNGTYDNTAPKFHHGDAGTSQAVAQVGGVVALMRSVDRYLGAPLSGGVPVDGKAVHKKAYDILTFTARKIEDNGREMLSYTRKEDIGGTNTNVAILLPGHPCWSIDPIASYYDSELISASDLANPQFNYVVQTYDNLKRSWAQRMGFGMVDAYRAIAHSIPMKASYKYQQSTTLVHGHVLNGLNFVHFGARVNEQNDLAEDRNNSGSIQDTELNVLQWGGADLPGQNHNNQGVTRIEGTNTTITVTVPQNFVAVIDGIVRTANNSTSRSIVTGSASGSTNEHGLIMMAGMLDGVQLRGRIKASDVLVNPEATTLTGITFQNHGSTSDPLSRRGSEIFGSVVLKNDGFLTVDRNATLTLQPGGMIDMQGNQNVVIKDGASLIMEYPSTIKGVSGRQVVVERGGKLIVKGKPSSDKVWRTELLASVDVKDGGKLIVEEDALLQLGNVPHPVFVEYGGAMECKPGSHTIIPNGQTLLCIGKLLAVGNAGKRVKISSDLTTCGDVVDASAASIMGQSISNPDVSKSILDFKHCRVDNVSIWAMDVPTAPVENCVFFTSRENTIRTMFSKVNSPLTNYIGAPAELLDFSVSNCQFFDKEEDINVNQWRGDDDYVVSGLVLNGLRDVTVQQSYFGFLMHGISTRLCDNVVVTLNNFLLSDYGLYDDGSSVLFCKNTCNAVERGNALTLSRASRTFDNTYLNVWSAVRGESAAQQYVRNNNIENFREGIYASNTPFVLQQLAASATANIHCPSMNPRLENGYNNFTSDDPLHLNAEFLELNSGGGSRMKAQQRDIYMRNNGVVGVSNGYNKFSVHSEYHVYREETPAVSMPVEYNQWNGPSGIGIRYNNIIPTGSVLNQEDDITRSCDILYGCSPIASGLICSDGTYNNDGDWTGLSSNDPYLDTVYVHARQEMINPGYDVMCRRVKAHDALEAAVLGLQKTTKLQQLALDYGLMASNSSNPNEVRSLAMVLKGEAHERLGEVSNAITAYTSVTTSYPASNDAEVSAWRLHYLSASTTGTVGSITYENAMNVYRKRVLEDMRLGSSGGGIHKQGSEDRGYAGVESVVALEALQPNPGDGEVTIVYRVGARTNVRLVVVDVMGREMGVVTMGGREAGEYREKWDGRHLLSGVYSVRLESNGQVQSLPLVIVK